MTMSLLSKAAEFERLCGLFVKKAQNAPQIDMSKPFRFNTEIPPASLSGPTPRYSVPTRSEALNPGNMGLDDFAEFLTKFEASSMPGTSVDVEAVKQAGTALSKAVAAKNNSGILEALKSILGLTRSGGGALYNNAQKLFDTASKSQTKNPPEWLNGYMAKNKNKSPAWLDQYMAGQDADSAQEGMRASLDQGSSVQETLNRKPFFPNLKNN